MTDLPESPMPKPIGAAEVVASLRRIAHQLQARANATVAAGYRETPDPETLRDIQILDNVSLVIEVLLPHWSDVRQMVRRLSRQKEGRSS